jgi:uncharacterized repeat protein (TIGR03806 family)
VTPLRALAIGVALCAACGGDGGDDGTPEEVCVVDAGDGPASLGAGPMCNLLSSYRMFADIAAQTPAAGVMPYDLNTALFSDYTIKQRFLWVPPGQTIQWEDVDSLVIPDGALIAKTFAYLDDRRAPAGGRRLLETRILARRAGAWEGAAYVHDPATGDAVVTSPEQTIDVTWIHDDGQTRSNAYGVPSKNQCKNCHEEHDAVVTPIGPKARHLNRPGPGGAANQLQDLVDRGWLAGAPADPMTWPRSPVFDDPATGTLDERARAWLDVSCAHCHNPTGAARTSGLDLSIGQTDPAQLGVCKPPIAAGQGSGGRSYGIVPGLPDESILVFRLESTEADIEMPELGRNLVDAEGLALVREWITAMPGSCPP